MVPVRSCPPRFRALLLFALGTLLALALLGLVRPGSVRAAVLPAAAPTADDTTPVCPVSPSAPECTWNVPADPTNVFGVLDYGECPYWAAEKYPALVLDATATDPLAGDWNGGTWIEHAQAEGLPISSTPASGDLAVWQPTAGDPAGHVAYVEAVLGSGIIVSQMDGASTAPFPPMQGSTEYIPDAALESFAQTYHLAYVVTGTPSPTPLASLERPGATSVSAPTVTVTPAHGISSPAAGSRPRPARSRRGTRSRRHRATHRARLHRATHRGHRRRTSHRGRTAKRSSRHLRAA